MSRVAAETAPVAPADHLDSADTAPLLFVREPVREMSRVSLLSDHDPTSLRRLAARLATRPGEYADLFLERLHDATIVRTGGATRRITLGGGEGAAARWLNGTRTRHASISGLGEDRLAALVKRLHDDAPAPLFPQSPGAGGDIDRNDALDGLERYLDEIHAAAERSACAEILFEGRVHVHRREIAVATSEGEVVEDERPWVTFGIRLGRAGDSTVVSDGGGGLDLDRLRDLHPPEIFGSRLVQRLEEQGETVPAPAGETIVILAPGPGGIFFHESCGHALEGDNAVSGRSPFIEMLGEKVGPDALTLVDDPTLAGLPGSLRIDDEGWRAQRTVLIENGRLVGLLLDRATALLASTTPTGSARRESYRDLPLPRMSNTIVREGPYSPEEILESVGRGVYIEELGAGEVDPTSATFSFHVKRGFLIAAGRMIAPIAPAVVSGNGVRALAGIKMIGGDLRFDGGAGECGKDGQRARAAVGQPTIRVDGLTVRPAGVQ